MNTKVEVYEAKITTKKGMQYYEVGVKFHDGEEETPELPIAMYLDTDEISRVKADLSVKSLELMIKELIRRFENDFRR